LHVIINTIHQPNLNIRRVSIDEEVSLCDVP
jgi:hypothetical protein